MPAPEICNQTATNEKSKRAGELPPYLFVLNGIDRSRTDYHLRVNFTARVWSELARTKPDKVGQNAAPVAPMATGPGALSDRVNVLMACREYCILLGSQTVAVYLPN